jgi:hypothetical protein
MDLEDSNWEMQIWKVQPRRVFLRRDVSWKSHCENQRTSAAPVNSTHLIDTRPILDPGQPDQHSMLTATIVALGPSPLLCHNGAAIRPSGERFATGT